MKTFYLVQILLFIKCIESTKILATIFTPSYSHQVAFRPLWNELLKKGHEITLLTTDPMNEPDLKNLREVDLSKSYDVMEKFGASDIVSKGRSSDKGIKELLDAYINALSKTADWQLSQPEVREIIQNRSEYFDLIMIEMMFPTHLGFVDRFNAPFIGLFSLDAPPRIHRAVGNFLHPVIYPDYVLPFTKNLTFLQRLISVIFSWAMYIYEYYMYQTEFESAKIHFGDYIRPLQEIEKDMSMLFINVNPLFHHIRPAGPNTIQIGGASHLKEIQPLPQDLQDFLNSANEGVIYFSLGSNVKSSLLTDRLKSVILETFAVIPYKIIWKFEEDLPEKPENVKIMKWVPQQDLLQHPKVILFITQCGLQSMEESIFSRVPMVGMPFYGDQISNAKILEEKGFGKTVSYMELTKDIFQDAILEVIKNPFYHNQVEEISKLVEDVEMSGLEKAVWWTEYTIRHHGAKHLKNPNVDLPVYKFYLLDVLGFILTVSMVFFIVSGKLIMFLMRLFSLKNVQIKKKGI